MKITYSDANNEIISVIEENGDIATVAYSKAHTIYGTLTPERLNMLIAMLLLAGRPDIAKEISEIRNS